MSKELGIILLAGGQGSRFNHSSPENSHFDKLLFKIHNMSLIEYVTRELKPFGEIIIVTKGEERSILIY